MAIHPALLDMVRESTWRKRSDFASLALARNTPTRLADLLAHGADANSQHPNGHTILHASDLPADTVRLLIAAGADVESLHYGAALRTPLFFASVRGVPTLLFHAGADLEANDIDGRTPLIFQAMYGRASMVEELLRLGANDRAEDRSGLDLLDHASIHLPKQAFGEIERLVLTHRARHRRQELDVQLGPRHEPERRRF